MTKRIAKILLASSAALLMTLTLSAQTYSMQAKVPFAFRAAGETLQAGNYEVREVNGISSVTPAGTGHTTFVSSHGSTQEGKKPSCLVFHRYGDRYFLSQVWSPYAKGVTMATSAAEKELIHSGARQEVAIVLLNSQHKG